MQRNPEALALEEVPDLLGGIRGAVPRVVLRVGDELQFFLCAAVNVALATRDVGDARAWSAHVALHVGADQRRNSEVVAATVTVAPVVLHHRVAGAMHDEEWNRAV